MSPFIFIFVIILYGLSFIPKRHSNWLKSLVSFNEFHAMFEMY